MPAPTIEGSYQLVRRELPDGTVVQPPAVKGMITYTKKFRNFSVLWKDENGKFYSECYVARYTLTDRDYTETSAYLIVHDEIGGKGIHYDLSPKTAKTEVSHEDGRISFDLPQPFERELAIRAEFEGNTLKATGKDLFIDYWERVS